LDLMKTLIVFTIHPAPMPTFPDPKPFPSLSSTLVNSPGRTGQHTLQCSQKWQQQKKKMKKKATDRPQMDWS
jgi:hypothetical protein